MKGTRDVISSPLVVVLFSCSISKYHSVMQRDAEDLPLCSCIGIEKTEKERESEREKEVMATYEIFIDSLIESRRIMSAVIRNNYCHGIATDHGSGIDPKRHLPKRRVHSRYRAL